MEVVDPDGVWYVSRVGGDTTYVVKRGTDSKHLTCSCPDYTYRRSEAGTMCKHGKAIMDWIYNPAARRRSDRTSGRSRLPR